MFLKDPWLWPEVWIINPQVENPHLIYPGDTLALAYGANGQPQIRLTGGGAARLNPRLRSNPLDGAIPTLPYSSIAAFLSKPTVLTKDQIKKAPNVLAFREKHMIGGETNEIYVRDLNAPLNSRYSVMHVGEPLRDPDNGDVLGYRGHLHGHRVGVDHEEPDEGRADGFGPRNARGRSADRRRHAVAAQLRAELAACELPGPHHLGGRRHGADRSVPGRRDQPRLTPRCRGGQRHGDRPGR